MTKQEVIASWMKECDDTTKSRGKRIYDSFEPALRIVSIDSSGVKLKVPSESRKKPYEVSIDFETEDAVPYKCSCEKFENSNECKHVYAALLFLSKNSSALDLIDESTTVEEEDDFEDDEVNEGEFDDVKNDEDYIDYDPVEKVSGLNDTKAENSIDKSIIEHQNFTKAIPGYKGFKVQLHSFNDYFFLSCPYDLFTLNNEVLNTTLSKKIINHLEFNFRVRENLTPHQIVHYDNDETIFVHCNCRTEQTTPCIHSYCALYYIQKNIDKFYFKNLNELVEIQNELLKPFGLTCVDPESFEFKFGYDKFGTYSILKKPEYYLDIKNEIEFAEFSKKLVGNGSNKISKRPKLQVQDFIDYEIGFSFVFSNKAILSFELLPIGIQTKKNKKEYKKLSLSNQASLAYLQPLSDDLYFLLEKLTTDNLKKHLLQTSHGQSVYNYYSGMTYLDPAQKEILIERYYEVLKQLWNYLSEQPNTFIQSGEYFSKKELTTISLSKSFAKIYFETETNEKNFIIQLKFKTDDAGTPVEFRPPFFFITHEQLFLLENFEQLNLIRQFPKGKLIFPLKYKMDAYRKIILPLKKLYAVTDKDQGEIKLKQTEFIPRVMLSELNETFLIVKPMFGYGKSILSIDEGDDFVDLGDKKGILYERDKEKEKIFFEELRVLHPLFEKQKQNPFYFLPSDEVMKNSWFIKTIAALKEKNIQVLGLKQLKKFNINPNLPTMEMKAGNDLDWFDLQIEIKFGDLIANLQDVQKAIKKGETMVALSDGSMGIIPEDWLTKFGMVMKMGHAKSGSLKISKMHFTVVDELHSFIKDDDLLRELAEKKEKLRNIENIKPETKIENINATLRPYQLSGFEWMQVLNELGWGGCLADDMGLGKTLQVITFLNHLKKSNPDSTHLVVCPTSLIYNWENEILKFCPSLRYHIYYGTERELNETHFADYDVIITSYGIMRNDIKELTQFLFHYIILDESQYIKNPDAQISKAVQVLRAKNKLIMSGTPVQNNTYDLYAQMNFLNPGLLGNREFFRTEFATPIDKNGDKDKVNDLRKLIFPFMLRRTKEQVATDLPDKTETILWCEMASEQRLVYEQYKNYYRDKLLSKIDEVGMKNAGIYVLEGLLRMRQICDSPELLKDEEVETKQSVKIEELLRELKENTGNHKVLVFSQFTEMLKLIRTELEKEKISFLYLDGSIPAATRKKWVDQFQTDDTVKIFLISLKAGGVGLNLTAADYVYLVDPWWNPAVEEQAIDRTHRIGQANKIFAYRMICKDSVEEKIMKLKERKKGISTELISEEKGFVKKLTRDDVEFLFS